jgi:segregation and condensation protein B
MKEDDATVLPATPEHDPREPPVQETPGQETLRHETPGQGPAADGTGGMKTAQAGSGAPAPHPVMAGKGPPPTALPEAAPQSAGPQSTEPQSSEPASPEPPPQESPPQESPAGFPGSGVHAPDGVDAPAASVSPDDAVRLAEALIFASAEPVSRRALTRALPEGIDLVPIIATLITRYAGRGVELAEIGSGLQFRTAADLAPLLRKVIEVPRRLPRVAMETLAIVAYHQPLTRSEIEELRGVSLSQVTLDVLLEMDLITAKGQRETPGRPTLWGTTARFLAQFGLKDLRDLPRREDLLLDLPTGNDAPVPPAPASC